MRCVVVTGYDVLRDTGSAHVVSGILKVSYLYVTCVAGTRKNGTTVAAIFGTSRVFHAKDKCKITHIVYTD